MSDEDNLTSFKEIQEATVQCNKIKYAAYRTAAKLRIWQKFLQFDKVSLNAVRNIFNHHHLLVTDARVIISAVEVEALLNDILFAASRLGGHTFDVDRVVSLTFMFLSAVFNSSDGLSILDVKVGLVCLCTAALNDKYCYLFSQLADHNLCLSRKRVKRLMESFIRLPWFLGENNSFNSSYIESTLDSCFSKSSELGVSESEFICWIVQEPQLLIWLSTLYRVQASENVSHNVRCTVCSTKPIVGLRYICMRCISYDMCQQCFFTGMKSKRHHAQHEIREYCAKASPCETMLLYVKGIIGRLFGNTTRLQYLPAVATENSPSDQLTYTIDEPIATSPIPSRLESTISFPKQEDQLTAIIDRLERETKDFVEAAAASGAQAVIEQHACFLKEQLNCLKSFKRGLRGNQPPFFMSTPIVPTRAKLQLVHTPLLLKEEGLSQVALLSGSNFSAWQKEVEDQGENSYSLKLQQDLDNIMLKLNDLINYTDDSDVDAETYTKF